MILGRLYTGRLYTGLLYTGQLYTRRLYTGRLYTGRLYTGNIVQRNILNIHKRILMRIYVNVNISNKHKSSSFLNWALDQLWRSYLCFYLSQFYLCFIFISLFFNAMHKTRRCKVITIEHFN